MSSYWVNFAATGNPNGKGLPEWPAYSGKKSAKNIVLGDTVMVGQGIDPAMLAFYDSYYAKLRVGPCSGALPGRSIMRSILHLLLATAIACGLLGAATRGWHQDPFLHRWQGTENRHPGAWVDLR